MDEERYLCGCTSSHRCEQHADLAQSETLFHRWFGTVYISETVPPLVKEASKSAYLAGFAAAARAMRDREWERTRDGKSISQPDEYAVKEPVRDIMHAARGDRATYYAGNGGGWVPCRHCAKRFSREAAHAIAHKTNTSCVVVRIIPKKAKKP